MVTICIRTPKADQLANCMHRAIRPTESPHVSCKMDAELGEMPEAGETAEQPISRPKLRARIGLSVKAVAIAHGFAIRT